jgi:hypothetical protein
MPKAGEKLFHCRSLHLEEGVNKRSNTRSAPENDQSREQNQDDDHRQEPPQAALPQKLDQFPERSKNTPNGSHFDNLPSISD